jgi:hypothetical protein
MAKQSTVMFRTLGADGPAKALHLLKMQGFVEVGSIVVTDAAHGWRDIATAPKDGTNFLALVSHNRKHHQLVGCITPSGSFVSWPGRWNYQPTHWQPLPACPEAAPEAAKDEQ